jgi:hypothetical protein
MGVFAETKLLDFSLPPFPLLKNPLNLSLLKKENKTLALCFAERFFKGGISKVELIILCICI